MLVKKYHQAPEESNLIVKTVAKLISEEKWSCKVLMRIILLYLKTSEAAKTQCL